MRGNLSFLGSAPQPLVRVQRGLREYLWDLKDQPAIHVEADIPDWYRPYPAVELSDFADWAEVARWALPLVQAPSTLPPALEALAAPWRAAPEEQRADAALRFVREQIRYFGMEDGIHAHKAHPPAQVLARRFGDCKDKALLLVTLLRGLGVDADVALTNSASRATLAERVPGPFAFNHAIVRATIQGSVRWFDPTLSSQRGPLSDLPYLPYARALVVSPSTSGLSTLPDPGERNSESLMEETWSARERGGSAGLKVITTWKGTAAESPRELLPAQTVEQITRQSLAYYRADEPAIEVLQPPAYRDEPETGRLVLEESFRIPSFWAGGSHSFDLDGARIRAPQDPASRRQPLRVRYPWHARQVTRIELPLLDWNLSAGVKTFESPAFRARIARSLVQEPAGPVYLIEIDARTTADHVAAADAGRYAKAVKDLREAGSFTLDLHGGPRLADAATTPMTSKELGWLVAMIVGIVATGMGAPRAVDAFRAWRSRRFFRKTQPRVGESAANPLEAADVHDVERAAQSRRCGCG